MDSLLRMIEERNERETTPFQSIHSDYSTLLNQIDALQSKCEGLERELAAQELVSRESIDLGNGKTSSSSAALKNETKLREKLEKMQEKLNVLAEEQTEALKTSKELNEVKDKCTGLESRISELQKEKEKQQRIIDHQSTELTDAKSRTKLAEQQYTGLKETIRILQKENELIKKDNRQLEKRLITEKEKMSKELLSLMDSADKLKKQNEMLKGLEEQEDKRSSWFGLSSLKKERKVTKESQDDDSTSHRQWGTMGVLVPTEPKHKIKAHPKEATCVRYDSSGADVLVTGSPDATVKVWDTSTAKVVTTLRGGTGNAILACDISNGIVAAGGTDKNCRVWSIETSRMIHILVGHANKITCCKLFGGERGVITGSADRSLKVWDISRQTYRQTATLRHSSTANAVDVGIDSSIAVSGHLDGGLRFWDVQTGERTAEINGLHEGAITFVQFHPVDTSKVMTNAMDSCIRILDVKKCSVVISLKDDEFNTSYSWLSCSFSPDGAYIGSGSSSDGTMLVWESKTGKLKTKVKAHDGVGIQGFAWGKGGASGQQVATLDRGGTLVLWA